MRVDKAFYGEKLRFARLLNGYTQQETGDLVSTTRQYTHQMEAGMKFPADDVLAIICEEFRVLPEFFESPLGNDIKSEQCHFRKRRTIQVGLVYRAMAFSTIFETLVSFIHDNLDLPSKNIPFIDQTSEAYRNEEIELAAEKCRDVWGLGLDNPISKVTRALENAGIVITEFNGVSDKVDAMSFNRKHPIIVRNIAKPSVCRMRFDLSHECGHLVLHDGVETGDRVTESEADKFASAFLFPRSAFLQEFGNMIGRRLDWNHIFQLKIRWGMSARAIVYRAHYLGLMDAKQYRSANIHLNKTGQSKVENFDDQIAPETPELLASSFSAMNDHLGISFSYISNFLGISNELLSELTGIHPSKDDEMSNVHPVRFV